LASGETTAAVLVVDDDSSIRLLCRVNLELDGFVVLEASSLEQARAQLDENVRVVLLDMRIGNERGDALLDELGSRDIPVIFISGSAEIEPEIERRAAASLGKPFSVDDLLAAVRAAAR
jgi:DNA-binding NtrC family response regulator